MNFIEILNQAEPGALLTTFLLSMVPVMELRGAIPIGVGMGLNPLAAMLVSIVGNMVPIPFIILFIRRIFAWLRRNLPGLDGLVTRLETKAHLKGRKVKKYKYLGLCIFVAIPLPGTGAWTGALIAALLDMSMRRALPSILLGVFIAACIITGLTFGFTSIIA
jgi:uncharacterized membrane protein